MKKNVKANNVVASMYDTLVRPVITEKSMLASEAGKIVFRVPLDASKEAIKAAVEGRRSDYKKALVTLAEGQNIDVTTGI